jgi:hypothetical protein
MRPAVLCLITIALSIVPRTSWAQVSITSPAAGAPSSYRTTVLFGPSEPLLTYRIGGSIHFAISRASLPPLPAMVEVLLGSELVDVFAILSWDDTGATLSQINFVPYVTLTYSGTLPDSIDIAALPDGDLMLAVSAWDGSRSAWRPQSFSKSSGQDQLVLTSLGAAPESASIEQKP